MANRRAAAANRIRGPQSALTDFLASQNISAQQIHIEYQRRLREAQEQETTEGGNIEEDDKENESVSDEEDAAERKKRKRKEEKAIIKIKQSKEFKRRKSMKKKGDDDDDEDDGDDTVAKGMMAKAKPIPGQLENCETCGKRFTVTPYCKTGPEGGLLCTPCSKALKDDEKKTQAQEKKKNAPAKARKRQTESDRMMGDVKPGAKSLVETCVSRVADVVHDIEEFGDMPQNLLDRLSQILSKRRVITSRTLGLFLRPDVARIAIYDCGKLEEEDFRKIFAYMPKVRTVNLRCAGQLKNAALRYMIEKNKDIRHLQLGATNLISNEAWEELFQNLGPQLESLKLSELNDSLNNDIIDVLTENCLNLRRLKLRQCSHTEENALISLFKLKNLEHLSIAISQNSSPDTLVKLIYQLGPNLRTLSLENYTEADDSVLSAIHEHCRHLTKLRFTGSSLCSDRAFADMFQNWLNPPVPFLDLSDNRDIDNANPDGPVGDAIGVGSEAFKALMKHSGQALERLNLHSCRHISYEALSNVFDGKKQYPLLSEIDFSFVTFVNEIVMRGIFKSCPQLKKLAVFACFNAKQVRIPAGIAVIGLPNAQESVVIEGNIFGEL